MNRPQTLISRSEAETVETGRRLGVSAIANSVLALVGPLGAGKTQLAKGLAAGLDVPDTAPVNSPTYVIINEYEGRLHVFHIDAYRLQDGADLADLGFDEICTAGGVVVIEWADKVQDILPADHLRLELTPTARTTRSLELLGTGRHARAWLSRSLRSQHEQT